MRVKRWRSPRRDRVGDLLLYTCRMLLVRQNDLFLYQYCTNAYLSGEAGDVESVLMLGDAITVAKR